MPDARRKRGARASSRRRLAIVGIGAFVLVDLGLVALALTRDPAGSAAEGTTLSTPSPSGRASTTPVPTTTPLATASPDAVPAARFLSAVDDTTAWRAEAGTCTPGSASATAAASVETTTTSGSTWVAEAVTTPGALTGIDRLQATDASTAFVVGPGATTCAPSFAQTFSAGTAFRDYPDGLSASWYVARGATAVVHSPSGDHAAPCPLVVDLAVVSDTQAPVLCSDHAVHRTTDGGATWGPGTTIDGAAALTASASTLLVVSTGVTGCDGTRVTALADAKGATGSVVGCAPARPDEPGAIAVSAASGSLWLWAGDDVLVSTDGGVTW